MKLSETTLTILKNFATISDSIYIQAGKVQRVMDIDDVILGEATLEDDFPNSFGIYDLQGFLSNFTALDNPTLTFEENHLVMDDGKFFLKYGYCSPTLLKKTPTSQLDIETPDAEFKLDSVSLTKIIKLANLNNLPELSIVSGGGELSLLAHEASNDTSNSVKISLGDTDSEPFNEILKIENLKMLPDAYNVKLAAGKFSLFTNEKGNLKYFIALVAQPKGN